MTKDRKYKQLIRGIAEAHDLSYTEAIVLHSYREGTKDEPQSKSPIEFTQTNINIDPSNIAGGVDLTTGKMVNEWTDWSEELLYLKDEAKKPRPEKQYLALGETAWNGTKKAHTPLILAYGMGEGKTAFLKNLALSDYEHRQSEILWLNVKNEIPELENIKKLENSDELAQILQTRLDTFLANNEAYYNHRSAKKRKDYQDDEDEVKPYQLEPLTLIIDDADMLFTHKLFSGTWSKPLLELVKYSSVATTSGATLCNTNIFVAQENPPERGLCSPIYKAFSTAHFPAGLDHLANFAHKEPYYEEPAHEWIATYK